MGTARERHFAKPATKTGTARERDFGQPSAKTDTARERHFATPTTKTGTARERDFQVGSFGLGATSKSILYGMCRSRGLRIGGPEEPVASSSSSYVAGPIQG